MDRQMIDYLPPIMREFGELEQICKVEQRSKEKLWQQLESAFNESHISTQTKAGAVRWEKTLGIVPKDTDSLEVRNLRIWAKLHENIPYTYRTLKEFISTLTGGEDTYSLVVDNDTYTVIIRVALKSKELMDEISVFADRVVPAHMVLIVLLMYNTHAIIHDHGKTHGELNQMTHTQVRETPLEMENFLQLRKQFLK